MGTRSELYYMYTQITVSDQCFWIARKKKLTKKERNWPKNSLPLDFFWLVKELLIWLRKHPPFWVHFAFGHQQYGEPSTRRNLQFKNKVKTDIFIFYDKESSSPLKIFGTEVSDHAEGCVMAALSHWVKWSSILCWLLLNLTVNK